VALTPGTRIGPYEIADQIGVGGMGEVYRARDSRLGRDVALKILPAALSGDPDRLRRFETEARAVSALNHPNILTIHDIGRHDGVPFIVSELIEGQTLRQRLAAGALPLRKAVDYATQLTHGLGAAHDKGIVHRDLKPENIVVTPDGRVKILDFGLAKLRPDGDRAAAPTQLPTTMGGTQPATILGTVGYMAPEQVRGQSADHRADIFAFGAVLHEMLTGTRAFAGASAVETMHAILKEDPPEPSRTAPDIPPALDRVVRRCLEKSQAERFQSARDLGFALGETVGVPSTPASGPPDALMNWADVTPRRRRGRFAVRAAVLLAAAAAVTTVAFLYVKGRPSITDRDTILLADFLNTTGDSVFDGGTLKQALVVQLRQTPFLNLLPEEALRETLRVMQRPIDERVTREIGREICLRQGLKAMIVGSIASLGHSYVVTLEALNGQTGDVIATEQAQADGKERVLGALNDAATGLRRNLGESLATLQKYNVPVQQATTASLEAWKAYAAATDLFVVHGDARGALPLLLRATELDRNFAEAYDGLSWVYANLGDVKMRTASAERAFSLRAHVTEIEKLYIADTYYHWGTGDWDKENEQAEVAKRLYPNDWNWPHILAINYVGTGQDEKAVAEEREAIRLNPNVVHGYRFLAIALTNLNRFDEARTVIRQTQARNLNGPFFRATLFAIAFAQGDTAATAEALDEFAKQDGERQKRLWQARAATFEGRWHEAEQLYRTLAAPSGDGTPELLPLEALANQMLLLRCDAEQSTARVLAPSRIIGPGGVPAPIDSEGSLCGDPVEAQKRADELVMRYPMATQAKAYAVPAFQAAIALARQQPQGAIEALKPAAAYGGPNSLLTNYLRGQAYLRLGNGTAAAGEFKKIVDHRGWNATSSFYPLAQLGAARAWRMAGDLNASRKAYQSVLETWKNADADLPILVQAKKEFADLLVPPRGV
jgi:tetratricopeptide (TPR) repeat protein